MTNGEKEYQRPVEALVQQMANKLAPRVLVGAPCGKLPVLAAFYDCFAAVVVPPGSPDRCRAEGGDIPMNLNKLVAQAQETKCTHLFIVEDDSVFAPDTVTRLLAHDVPVAAGLLRSRQAPFMPYIYKGFDQATGLSHYPLLPTDRGLIGGPGFASGLGGILINMSVFDILKRPYFTNFYEGEQRWGQDIIFGRDLIQANIPVYIDLDVVIGHYTGVILGSEQAPSGSWLTVLRFPDAVFRVKTC